jgi:PKHD-type hydroxylase
MLTPAPRILNYVTYPYVYKDDFFTKDELDHIKDFCNSHGTEKAEVVSKFGKAINVESLRNSDIKMHGFNNENSWIFDKLFSVADTINKQYYGYDLTGFEYFQYTEYNNPGSEYGYHTDMIMGEHIPLGMELPRKLSFSLILSDPLEYEGGEFEFLINGIDRIIIPQIHGRVLAFPSYIIHRIAPLISGSRKSLVFWAVGPKFK